MFAQKKGIDSCFAKITKGHALRCWFSSGKTLKRSREEAQFKLEGAGYAEMQRWVGRRIHPENCAFTILPWGFVPQSVVKEKIVPNALRRLEDANKTRFFQPARQLKIWGTTIADMQEGAELAYRFLTTTFSQGEANFEETHQAQIDKHLGACFDMQLRQIENPLIQVHAVHQTIVTSAFPMLLCDPTNPENLVKSETMWKYFGVNQYTAQLHFAKIFFSKLMQQVRRGEDEGFRLAVEIIVRTSETPHFGPNAGMRIDDAEHVLWFYGGRGQDILSEGDVSFELVNMNEALSMIQDTATPEAWSLKEEPS